MINNLSLDKEEQQIASARTNLLRKVVAASASRAPELPLPIYVTIKAGTFPVAESRLFGDVRPTVDRVTITRDFEIGKTKVTVEQFAAFVKATNYAITGQGAQGAKELLARLANPDEQNHPVNFVNRDQDAKTYCEWLDEVEPRYVHFLPTAAQWELATRGQEGREFPWVGEWDPDKVVGSHNSSGDTKPVDFTQCATLEGMRDLGNLLEWTSTWYGQYDPTDTTDPHGPENGGYAELRGGSWGYDHAGYFRSAYRGSYGPLYRSGYYGFRVARTKKQ